MVTLVTEPQYQRLCAVIGREDLASDPRFADFAKRSDFADELMSQMRDAFLTQTTEKWLARLQAADIISERILSPVEWLRDKHVDATKGSVCMETPGVGLVYSARTPGTVGLSEDALCPAPAIGQDSIGVLSDFGYSRDAIDAFIVQGAVHAAPIKS
jgi:crotonobetainyl-CoA:carnitine CoA-transferase CaiB-like acyl-CoA transferase